MPFHSRVALSTLATLALAALVGAQTTPVNKANWKLAERYGAEALRPFVYSTDLTPNWINKGDTFWYSWRGPDGVHFWRVDAKSHKKEPLFDTAHMAALLSEATKRPYDATTLPITTVSFDEKNDKLLRFNVDRSRYEYDLEKDTLKNVGAATREAGPPAGGRGGNRGGGAGFRAGAGRDFRNWSPDKKAYVYAQDYNLYYVEVVGDKEKPPVQLTKDGERYHSFGSRQEQDERAERARLTGQGMAMGMGRGGNRQGDDAGGDDDAPTAPENRVRANVTWSDDSKRFFVQRSDERKVKELYLVNSLTEPRPTLLTYKYDMPGEVDVSQTELYVFNPATQRLDLLPVEKYKDQTLSNVHFQEKVSDKLRFSRRDRLQRNLEFCELDLATKKVTPLIVESVENASLEVQPVRYVKPGGDMLWWSERSGWGHYYLYSNDGKLKNAVDAGPFRATRIVAVDGDKGTLWLTAVGREKDENPYYHHLYRVGLDGKGMALLDPGDADHSSSISEDRKYVVDVRSRTDLETQATLRDDEGKPLVELEKADLARLKEVGWAMPETFKVKAADGVTDLWGNMWKPADFDPKKRYPIITYVYPGPQTEAVTTTFTAMATNARLAQLGFIVISMGNRGGNPDRSNAYQNYGYGNLRDYGLADKKAGIEQLAARYPWIDLDRVGIYGHSGGGFMTAAAMMLPPYNSFFKVGWSESGNHDNNVYNQNWAEQYHGLKVVSDTAKTTPDADDGFTPTFPDTPQFSDGGSGSTKFQIKVPTNAELAANLKGNLMLVHGDMDDNVHYAGTYRLMNALMRANKRFDLIVVPGKPHAYGDLAPYVQQRMFEYFAQYLLGDRYGVGDADLADHN